MTGNPFQYEWEKKEHASKYVKVSNQLEPTSPPNMLQMLFKMARANKDKAVLVATAIVLIGMLLFPPFHVCVPTRGGAIYERNKGYSFILQPPYDELGEGVKVNAQLLGLQCVIVCAAGAMLWVVFRKR